jgi:hypothetical protein
MLLAFVLELTHRMESRNGVAIGIGAILLDAV